MSEKLLVVAPRFDQATEYSFEWAKNFLMRLDNSTDVTSLLDDSATKDNFDANIPYHDSLVFFDHGVKDALIGENLVKLVTNTTVGKLTGKKVFTMACLSASELGRFAYHSGCLEYWGATESIGFTLVDANLFGEVFVEGAYQRFIQDLPIEVVLQNMKEHFNTQVEKTDNPWTKMWLQKDRDMWTCWYSDNEPTEPEPISWWKRLIDAILEFLNINFATRKECVFDVN